MKDRREPTISTTINTDQEEAPRAQETHAGASSGSTGASRGARATPAPVSSRPVVVRSPLGPIALMVALLACVGAGYLYWLLLGAEDAIAQARDTMSQAEARIEQLEGRLALSDDESTESMSVVQAKVKENASEIRKLWGVAYDRNRNAIAELESGLEAVRKSVSANESQQSTTAASVKETANSLKEMTGEFRVLSELMEAQQAAMARADQNYQQQANKLQNVLTSLDSLEQKLSKRIGGNEEAIKAIDAFRRQVNRELIELKGG